MTPVQPVFKTDLIKRRFEKMHPQAQELLLEMIAWANDNGIQAIVTETATTYAEDLKLKRMSSTHREGRAFDISTKGWSTVEIIAFQQFFEPRYGHLGATSHKTGAPRLIVHHDAGTGAHFHVQLNRQYAVHWEKEEENGEEKEARDE